jgi:hypothetical protein
MKTMVSRKYLSSYQ